MGTPLLPMLAPIVTTKATMRVTVEVAEQDLAKVQATWAEFVQHLATMRIDLRSIDTSWSLLPGRPASPPPKG